MLYYQNLSTFSESTSKNYDLIITKNLPDYDFIMA